ncbi:AlpA family transcriptional regulator [Pseudomonas sp. LS44]|uniref:AlpA family transcriptional regulator n=1 Tax=Pseudomonas sp. LS44 TaxID=1357074 RepID=UPI00215B3F11|nr:AlpA family transcriptional regulator [Pseudomonas sp. LS44]UVE19421.1 AlpA family transcriptional regulator [Pseudomonas sp. LS44]
MTTLSNLPTHHSAVSYSRRFLRLPEVELVTGFKRSHIYNLMKTGAFPQALKLGLRAVAWDSVAIEQWQMERLAPTRAANNAIHSPTTSSLQK